jgi:hypothetical protein
MRNRRIKAIKVLEEIRQSVVFVLWTVEDLEYVHFYTLDEMLEKEDPSADIDLVVLSHGGSAEVGYRIGRTFQKRARRKGVAFRVVVPLYAKSAATLLSLGANQIVMGSRSEIGPIDPQIPKFDRSLGRWIYVSAMAIVDGLKFISEFLDDIPAMDRVFKEILRNQPFTVEDIGSLERMRETIKQYAQELLFGGMFQYKEEARECADRLVDYYKYHGYPIDSFHAEEVLKLKVKHSDGDEWEAITAVSDEFESFVGRPFVELPGVVYTCAIETAKHRYWRWQSSLDEGHEEADTLAEIEECEEAEGAEAAVASL